MNTYHLKVLNQTSTTNAARQSVTEIVRADGWQIEGEGRIYLFWRFDDEKRETTACYPTSCTIIERVSYEKDLSDKSL